MHVGRAAPLTIAALFRCRFRFNPSKGERASGSSTTALVFSGAMASVGVVRGKGEWISRGFIAKRSRLFISLFVSPRVRATLAMAMRDSALFILGGDWGCDV